MEMGRPVSSALASSSHIAAPIATRRRLALRSESLPGGRMPNGQSVALRQHFELVTDAKRAIVQRREVLPEDDL
jgi:hypothetical protein